MIRASRDHFYIEIPQMEEGSVNITLDNYFLIDPGWVRIGQYKPGFEGEHSIYISPDQLGKIVHFLMKYKTACDKEDDQESYWRFIESNGREL